ncbi:MAG: hypothetical protein IPM04_14920 [Saprospiraceae bacterium]|nr:hypothetical protein [Candidatus Brachybacter algidus]MBK8749053.1 hypothetical protein [Candidatus Brachybacter algidus]
MSRISPTVMRCRSAKQGSGSNAFSHSSGIHQNGFRKDALTKSINPDDVGLTAQRYF